MRRYGIGLLKATALALQGWGSTSTSGSGGWGNNRASGNESWGDETSPSSKGGWGAPRNTSGGSGGWGDDASAPSKGGWGAPRNTSGGSGGWGDETSPSSKGGWGAPRNNSGGSGGWGDDASAASKGGWGAPRKTSGRSRGWGDDTSSSSRGGWDDNKQWNGGDGGWGGAPTGSWQGSGRGNFRRGRGSGWGRDGAGGGHDTEGWGKSEGVDEEAWRAAPPSFTPPVRRIDPLTLTAVEVEIDGIKKLVGQRVQITGLAEGTSWQTLKDHFRQVGEVVFCKLFSNGRAMVEFSTPEDAARAITELQGAELEGATLFLREDREDAVLINTRRKIREAREAQLRARKEEAERARKEQAIAEGDRPSEHLECESEASSEGKPQLFGK